VEANLTWCKLPNTGRYPPAPSPKTHVTPLGPPQMPNKSAVARQTPPQVSYPIRVGWFSHIPGKAHRYAVMSCMSNWIYMPTKVANHWSFKPVDPRTPTFRPTHCLTTHPSQLRAPDNIGFSPASVCRDMARKPGSTFGKVLHTSLTP
jgi:hypothetical protein